MSRVLDTLRRIRDWTSNWQVCRGLRPRSISHVLREPIRGTGWRPATPECVQRSKLDLNRSSWTHAKRLIDTTLPSQCLEARAFECVESPISSSEHACEEVIRKIAEAITQMSDFP